MENQFQALKNWTFEVLNAIKKDIKSDHPHTDPVFYRTHFGTRPQNKITNEELFAAYEKELFEGNQELADWVVNRWVFKHGDLYQHFADRLSQINPNFDELTQLTIEQSNQVLEGAAALFGAVPTFLFSLLNGVVFPKEVIERLEKQASLEKQSQEKQSAEQLVEKNLEKIIASNQREIARLNEKIAGVQKKYTTDTEVLKKQIKALQQKLHVSR